MNKLEFQQVASYGNYNFYEGFCWAATAALMGAAAFIHFYLEPQLISIVIEQASNDALSAETVKTASFILDLKKYLFLGGIGGLASGLYFEHKKELIDRWEVRYH